jgi:hypothetical protein
MNKSLMLRSSGGIIGHSGYDHGFTDKSLLVAYEVISPTCSYAALAFVISVVIVIIISKLVITVETTKSDLVIYNTSPQKLELLVSKPASNSAAVNNVHAAIALGLMDPPTNYKPPAHGKMNGTVSHHNGSVASLNEHAETKAPPRHKKSVK